MRGVRDRARVWEADGVERYDPVGHGLSVKEQSMTPLETGPFLLRSTLVSTPGASVLLNRAGVRMIGVTVVRKDCVTFAIPAAWNRECLVNGEAMRPNRVYMPSDCLYIQGDRRAILGIVLGRRRFIDTIAALRGQDSEDVRLEQTDHDLEAAAIARLRARLLAGIQRYSSGAGLDDPDRIEREIFGLMAEAYLRSRPEARPDTAAAHTPTRIVRRAEDRFAAARGKPVSLADLCEAAGVSKSTLYKSFNQVCGESPLAYFRKRQLVEVRTQLHQSAPERGMVKRAALGAGLTELGRFAGEYRRLFGELPSVTLHRAPD